MAAEVRARSAVAGLRLQGSANEKAAVGFCACAALQAFADELGAVRTPPRVTSPRTFFGFGLSDCAFFDFRRAAR